MQPLDLLGLLPRSSGSAVPDEWFALLNAERWCDRHRALKCLLALLADQTQLVPADYTDVIRGLARCLSGHHHILVTMAARAIAKLVTLLGKDVGECARSLIPLLLKRGGVRNTQVAEAVHGALEALACCSAVNLVDAIDGSTAAAVDKDKLVQVSAMKFLRACAAKATTLPDLPALMGIVLPLTDSKHNSVRDGAFAVLAAAAACTQLDSDAAMAWLDELPPEKSLQVHVLLGHALDAAISADPDSDAFDSVAVNAMRQQQ